MTKFISNVNRYLSHMKIKQTYISLKSGIDTKKLSRILTGSQDVTGTDMEKIAHALGKEPEYFLSLSDVALAVPGETNTARFSMYAGEPGRGQERLLMDLIGLIENADEILSAKGRYMMDLRGMRYGD